MLSLVLVSLEIVLGLVLVSPKRMLGLVLPGFTLVPDFILIDVAAKLSLNFPCSILTTSLALVPAAHAWLHTGACLRAWPRAQWFRPSAWHHVCWSRTD